MEQHKASSASSLPLNPLIQARLNLPPEPHHLHIPKRNNLTRNNPTQPILPISPPKQIRQPSPPCGTPTPSRRARVHVQEERQPPTLRLVVRLRIQLRQRIAELRLGRYDGLTREIRHLGDLVREHLFHRLGLQDLRAGLGVRAVVEECRDDLAVFRGLGEAAGAAGVEGAVELFFGEGQERAPVDVAVRVDHEFAICKSEALAGG
jgi:hypothetical protein